MPRRNSYLGFMYSEGEGLLTDEKGSLTGKAHGFRGNLDAFAARSAKNQAFAVMSDMLVVVPGNLLSQRIAIAASR